MPFPLFVEESLDQRDFFGRIKTEISQKIEGRQAILVVFESYATLELFREHIRTHPITHADYKGLPEELHDEMDHNARNGVVSRSTSICAVTLMTRTFGRGTDFKCHNGKIESAGGMHVILTYLPQSKSEKIQIQGRTCRQDYSGSFREIFWAQDLKNAGYVKLSNGKVELEGYSGATAKEDLLEAKRCMLDDAEVDKLFECLKSNTLLWNKTQEFIASAGLSNLGAAFDALKEFQASAVAGTGKETHTVFIIDESGSMRGDEWTALQSSFSAYLTVLSSNGSSSDIVSVIQFDNTARIVAESLSAHDAAALNLSMNGGGTAFGPALSQTIELLRRDSSTCDIVLVFMTDGQNGDGDAPIGILRELFGKFASRNPKFNAIGFTNQPPTLVKMVAAVAPDSALYAADDSVQLQRAFVEVAETMCMSEGVRKK